MEQIFYNLWGADFKKLEKRAKAAILKTDSQLELIDRARNSNRFCDDLAAMLNNLFAGSEEIDDLEYAERIGRVEAWIGDIYADYMERAGRSGGDITGHAKEWLDNTNGILRGMSQWNRFELDVGEWRKRIFQDLPDKCTEYFDRIAADRPAVEDKAAEGIESFIKPEHRPKTEEIMKVLDDCCRIECRNLKAKGMATVMLAALRSGIFDKIPPYRSIQDHFGKIAPHGIGAYSSFMPQIRDDGKWSKISEDDLERTMKRLKGVLRG
jgi:hypothetical protein